MTAARSTSSDAGRATRSGPTVHLSDGFCFGSGRVRLLSAPTGVTLRAGVGWNRPGLDGHRGSPPLLWPPSQETLKGELRNRISGTDSGRLRVPVMRAAGSGTRNAPCIFNQWPLRSDWRSGEWRSAPGGGRHSARRPRTRGVVRPESVGLDVRINECDYSAK